MSVGVSTLLLRLRSLISVVVHLTFAALSYGAAFALRFDGEPPPWALAVCVQTLPWLLMSRGIVFLLLRLHEGLWRYTGLWDLQKLIVAIAASTVVFGAINTTLIRGPYPRSVYAIDALLLLCLLGGVRLARRALAEVGGARTGKRVIVYGAGDAGETIVRDMQRNGAQAYRPVGFVDDERAKVGKRIHGVRVLGTGEDLPRIITSMRPDEILVAILDAEPARLRAIVQAVERFSIPIKTLPSLRDLIESKVEIGHIRNLTVTDLLSRGAVKLDPAPVRAFLAGRRVLVTGAGGSIGSELCRQIASFNVVSLVLLDHAENGLARITSELAERGAGLRVHTVVADITDRARVEAIFARYRPDVIFHAAAHKHVPLMEENPAEAVKNNVRGTRILAEGAERARVARFIQISSDKAVNPSSVMGVTKRVAELLLQIQGRGIFTSFVTVRFGNVLASEGSVIPRFQEQIKRGGPVTVTHPEIRRFFMSIPEAVQLVLHAAAHGDANHLYALQMGEQIKVVDMARNLIRLSGFVPDEEIPITFVGLRPGEKLYEELVGSDEKAVRSPVDDVMEIELLRLPERDQLMTQVAELEEWAQRGDEESVVKQLGVIVPAFAAKCERLEDREERKPGVPLKVLFVCSANVARSRAAEDVFREVAGHRGHETRSAGTAFSATRRLTTKDMAWADLVAVMEDRHLAMIRRDWPRHVGKVRVLDVPDDYDPGEDELRLVLAERIQAVLGDLS